ncbi:tetrahydrodipicolinate N-succinyltransferase N-terminal domain-containing protein [Campylobacter sp. MG1]|uniref:tetrahydrodipicolinate N-succinyltransferase N-terminal domain-containing protein n=1 Tax=Campylobacter sp. MG1 TaxID=2976332 RepID=UPI00226CBB52|nr:tetrahydrodipicolinate N-succinyltransferase N-terminal domain-containing protein [Campylobacter sp. MG1]
MENFKKLCESIKNSSDFFTPTAFSIGVGYFGQVSKNLIYIDFANVNYNANYNTFAILFKELNLAKFKNDSEFCVEINEQNLDNILEHFKCFENEKGHTNIDVLKAAKENIKNERFFLVAINKDDKPQSIPCVYLKLHLLSRGFKKPREQNLNGAFGLLKNLAWNKNTPYELEYLREYEAKLKFSKQYPNIDFVDKFPRFLQSIIPNDNVRILDTSKVRLGAHLANGTTIMPGASYVNFNAGTLGSVMCEGRISSSAIVGDGSDVGGGASILGVLSGTDGNPISIGKRCLLGANSVTGIILGDDCIIDAGIAVLAGSKFELILSYELKNANPNFNFNKSTYKGSELSGLNALHFRQNSTNGKMQVSFNKKAVKLNSDLH